MSAVGDLGSDLHSGLFLNLVEPCESGNAYSFKTSGLGTGFPDACAKYLDTGSGETAGRGENLFLCLRATWAGDNQGTAEFITVYCEWEYIIHICIIFICFNI